MFAIVRKCLFDQSVLSFLIVREEFFGRLKRRQRDVSSERLRLSKRRVGAVKKVQKAQSSETLKMVQKLISTIKLKLKPEALYKKLS